MIIVVDVINEIIKVVNYNFVIEQNFDYLVIMVVVVCNVKKQLKLKEIIITEKEDQNELVFLQIKD